MKPAAAKIPAVSGGAADTGETNGQPPGIGIVRALTVHKIGGNDGGISGTQMNGLFLTVDDDLAAAADEQLSIGVVVHNQIRKISSGRAGRIAVYQQLQCHIFYIDAGFQIVQKFDLSGHNSTS